MYNQLKRLGIWNTSYWRCYISNQIIKMFNNPSCAYIQSNGKIAREAMLYGPGGGIKIRTIWQGIRLISIELFGKGKKI